MKKSIKGILCFLFAVVLVLCIAAAVGSRDAYAWEGKHFSGTVYASELDGVDHVVLDGDLTVILRDGDNVTVNCFKFDYNDNSGARTLTITGSNSGVLRVLGSNDGYGYISMRPSSKTYIQGGHVIVGGIGVTRSSCLVGNSGLLVVSDGILEVRGDSTDSYWGLYGIDVNEFRMSGNAVVNVNVTSTGSATALLASTIKITGGMAVLNASTSASGKNATGIGTASSIDGSWWMNGGDVTANAIAPNGYGYGISTAFNELQGQAEIIIEGGSLNVYGSYLGIDTADKNDIMLTGNAVVRTTAGKRSAMMAQGNLSIGGNAVLFAEVEDTSGSNTQYSSYGAVYVKGSHYVSGTHKIVAPSGGYWKTTGSSGSAYVADSSGNRTGRVVIAPSSNATAWEARYIYVNGNVRFSDENRYYKNGATSATSSSSGWNAYYEPETGTLYLNGYSGKSIGISREYGKKLTIDLSGNNYVNGGTYYNPVEVGGNDVEITARRPNGKLYVSGQCTDANQGGAAIAPAWATGSYGNGKKLVVSGNAQVFIDFASEGAVKGIYALGDVVIKDHALVDINAYYGKEASGTFAGLYTTGSLIITTDQGVNSSIAARDEWENLDHYPSAYALYLPNHSGPNASSRFVVLNADYVSFSAVGDEGDAELMYQDLIPSLRRGLAYGYEIIEFSGNDSHSVFIRSKELVAGRNPICGALFPDPSFRNYVLDKIDDGDGWLTNSEIAGVDQIVANCSYSTEYADAHSIAGVELFYNLESLTWTDSFIRTLDLSVNGMIPDQMVHIQIPRNRIKTVDLSGLNELLEFNAAINQLESLDLSDNPELGVLYVPSNNISSLDLSSNPELGVLSCGENRIESLDLTSNKDLLNLECVDNGMSSLILGEKTDLNLLYCFKNQLSELDVSGAPLMKDAYLNGTHVSNSDHERYYKGDNDLRIDSTTTVKTTAPEVALKAANLTLEGKISINFKVQAPDAGYVAKLYYEKSGFAQVAEVPLNSSHFVPDPENYDYYLVTYSEVPAKEMTLNLRIKVFDAYGNQVPMKISSGYIDQYDYSVAKWCNNKINQNNNADDVMIAKALLNYGHYSQLALKYNDGINGRPNKLANPNGYLAEEMANFAGGNSAYDSVTAGGTALGAKAFALVLESNTSIKLKLRRQVSVLIDGAAAVLTPETDGDGTQIWSVFKTDIAAKKLHEKSSFKLTEGSNFATIYYGALSWANKKLTGEDVNDKNLAKAMYLYNYAARKYFHYDEAGLQ